MTFESALAVLLSAPAFRDLHAHLVGDGDLFRVLRIEGSELQHAALIAWLLDPGASHGFGARGMEEFVACLQSMAERELALMLDLQRLDLGAARVDVEWVLPDGLGRADILVSVLHDGDRRPLMMIEHKVNAGVHGKQLENYQTWAATDGTPWRAGSTDLPLLVLLAPGGLDDEAAAAGFLAARYDDVLVPWLRRLLELGGTGRARLMVEDLLQCLLRRGDVHDEHALALVDSILRADGRLGQAVGILQRDKQRLAGAELSEVVADYGVTLRVLNLAGRVASHGDSQFVADVRAKLSPDGLSDGWRIMGGSGSLVVRWLGPRPSGIDPRLTIQMWLEAPSAEKATMSLEVVGPSTGAGRAEVTQALRDVVASVPGWPHDVSVGRGGTKVVRCRVRTPGIFTRDDDVPETMAESAQAIARLTAFARCCDQVLLAWSEESL